MLRKALFTVACMVLGVGGFAQAAAPNQSAAMIVSNVSLTVGFDQAMFDRLVAMGYVVKIVPDSDVTGGVFTITEADTYDVLLISESIGSSRADKLIGTTAPVMHNESYGWDNWSFTTATNMHWASGTSVDIVQSSHPIAAMAGVKVGLMTFFSTSASWTTESVSALAPGAELIAQITDAGTDCAIIFAIEEGAQLANGNAASARIVGFSIPGNNSYPAGTMTAEGWAIFDAAIRWMTHSASPVKAKDPRPADSATDVLRDGDLSWVPGEFAKTHNVYFGTIYDDVNDGVALVSSAQDANSYDPGRLEFGRSYFWRVDEVNALPDSTVFKGDVWRFTVEPFAQPILAGKITATASSTLNANSGPQKTVDGSGLNTLDQHDITDSTMWTSGIGQQTPVWIQYEFDAVYKLDQMWVWNSNYAVESLVGLGVKTASIEYSTDGTTWTALTNVPELAQAPGADDYAHNTTVDFGGVTAKFVRMTCTRSWSGRNQYGLSEVRFLYIPVTARDPEPATGVTGVPLDTTLSWRAGREVASHEIHLGTNLQAVTDSTAPSATVSQAEYAPADLQLDTTYYWKVIEVNQAETPSRWAGDVWSFTTSPSMVVDDFESYTNKSPKRVFQTWIDGVGFSPDDLFPNGNKGNGTGSYAGYDPALGSIMETKIVHGGRQSLPFSYNGLSEITRTLDPAQDWTQGGIRTLVLFFQGPSTNGPGELYVKINGTKVSYNGNAGDLAAGAWKQWNVDLPAAGLGAVKTLTIGVSSGQGLLLIDDIQLE